jgi:hypothetical protein
MLAEILKLLCIPLYGALGCLVLNHMGIDHSGFGQSVGMGTGVGSAMAYCSFMSFAFIDEKLGDK